MFSAQKRVRAIQEAAQRARSQQLGERVLEAAVDAGGTLERPFSLDEQVAPTPRGLPARSKGRQDALPAHMLHKFVQEVGLTSPILLRSYSESSIVSVCAHIASLRGNAQTPPRVSAAPRGLCKAWQPKSTANDLLHSGAGIVLFQPHIQ